MITSILTAIAPILVALIGIVPTVIANRKKTQESIEASNKSMKESYDKLQRTIDNHIREDENDSARNRRYRILRFYDELCEGRRHSESHFEDILDDIDAYEEYCRTHPDYHNSRGHVAMKNIQLTYDRLKQEGKFLAHERDKEESA